MFEAGVWWVQPLTLTDVILTRNLINAAKWVESDLVILSKLCTMGN